MSTPSDEPDPMALALDQLDELVKALREQVTVLGQFGRDDGTYVTPAALSPKRMTPRSAAGSVGTEADAMTAGGSWSGVWSVGKRVAVRDLDGRTWDEQPTALGEGRA